MAIASAGAPLTFWGRGTMLIERYPLGDRAGVRCRGVAVRLSLGNELPNFMVQRAGGLQPMFGPYVFRKSERIQLALFLLVAGTAASLIASLWLSQ